MCGCRSPQRLFELACDRDPTICNPPIKVYKLDAPTVKSELDCEAILRGFEIVKIREYIDQSGKPKKDSIRLSVVPHFTNSDTTRNPSADIIIDCPDPEVIQVPYPVAIKPGFWFKAEWMAYGAFAMLVISILAFFLLRFKIL